MLKGRKFKRKITSRIAATLLSLMLCVSAAGPLQAFQQLISELDAQAQVDAVVYHSALTQNALKQQFGEEIFELKEEIVELEDEVETLQQRHTSASSENSALKDRLASKEREIVAALEAKDPLYSRKISFLRAAAIDITKTPEGIRALAEYNNGNKRSAINILKRIRAADDAVRAIDSAASARTIAKLSEDARLSGDFSTAELIQQYEEITSLDSSVHWDWVTLSRLYVDFGDLGAAEKSIISAYQTAKDGYERYDTLQDIGLILERQGSLDKALHVFEQKLSLTKNAISLDPTNTWWKRQLTFTYNSLGNLYARTGHSNKALQAYNSSLVIRKQLAENEPANSKWQHDLSVTYANIADIYDLNGKLQQSMSALQKSVLIYKKLLINDSSNTKYKRGLFANYSYIAHIHKRQGNLDKALYTHRKSFKGMSQLTEMDSTNSGWQHQLSITLDDIGYILEIQGNLDKAMQNYLQSFAIRQQLVKKATTNTAYQRSLSISYGYMAQIYTDRNKLGKALKSYRNALAITQTLIKIDKSNTEWQRDLALSFNSIGKTLKLQGAREKAHAALLKGLAVTERLVKLAPETALWQTDLATGHKYLGDITGDKSHYRKALKIIQALRSKGKLDPAQAWMIEELKGLARN